VRSFEGAPTCLPIPDGRQCPYDAAACGLAAHNGHLEIVRFLHESHCPWDADTICAAAAKSGNMKLLQYLKQEGCVFSEEVMSTAAERGDLRMCQYLCAEQCPWEGSACSSAAKRGHVDTLRWLHEQGCPWDSREVGITAALSGHLSVIVYVVGAEPAPSAALLTELLNAAAINDHLAVAQWLRQRGAQWPAVLKYSDTAWKTNVLQWARDEGCNAPTTV
jgi:hypothetical protein